MADCDIFREQLAIKYPSYGLALWEPSPRYPDKPVQVGDVGFIRKGKFHRLFNVLLPENDPSHECGVPNDHKPLVPNLSNHLVGGSLAYNNYCSAGVSVEPDPGYHSRPGDIPQVTFKYNGTRGAAVLSLPVTARREDTLSQGDFKLWIVKHIDSWFAFARKLGLGIERMEEIILVTGCDRTKSWANIAFLGNQDDSQVSFGVSVENPDQSITFQFLPENAQGAVLHHGPEGKNLPENQCVFIRGYRVARTFWIFPRRLKAAAGPSRDPDGYDCDSDTEVISIPAITNYRDPLHLLLDYIAEEASDCDMVLTHDDDLANIDGIGHDSSLETFEPDVMMDLFRRSNMEIQKVPCVSATDGGSNTDTSVVMVAMVSMKSQSSDIGPQCQGSPLAQSIDLSCASELHVPGSFPVPMIRENRSALKTSLPADRGDGVLSTPQALSIFKHATEHIVLALGKIRIEVSNIWSSLGKFAHVERSALRAAVVLIGCAVSLLGWVFSFTWDVIFKLFFTLLLASFPLYLLLEREYRYRLWVDERLENLQQGFESLQSNMAIPTRLDDRVFSYPIMGKETPSNLGTLKRSTQDTVEPVISGPSKHREPLLEGASPHHIEVHEENTSDTMGRSSKQPLPHSLLEHSDSETDASDFQRSRGTAVEPPAATVSPAPSPGPPSQPPSPVAPPQPAPAPAAPLAWADPEATHPADAQESRDTAVESPALPAPSLEPPSSQPPALVVPSQPAPAPSAPKTWASMAAANSKKWGSGVAQESRDTAVESPAPRAAPRAPSPEPPSSQPPALVVPSQPVPAPVPSAPKTWASLAAASSKWGSSVAQESRDTVVESPAPAAPRAPSPEPPSSQPPALVVPSQPAPAPSAPKTWASLAAASSKWGSAVAQESRDTVVESPAPAVPPAPSPEPPSQPPALVVPSQPAPAPAPSARKTVTWASLAASNPKKWGPAVAQESRDTVVESPTIFVPSQPVPAPSPSARKTWASLAAANPKEWGSADAQESRNTAVESPALPAPSLEPPSSQPPAPVALSQPAPSVPKTWASLAAANSKKWGSGVAQESRDTAVESPALPAPSLEPPSSQPPAPVALSQPAPSVPKTWASLAAANSKKWGSGVAQESLDTTVESQPAPAPSVPKTWANLAAANSKKWSSAVAQESLDTTVESQPAPAPSVPKTWANLAAANPKKWGSAVAQESRITVVESPAPPELPSAPAPVQPAPTPAPSARKTWASLAAANPPTKWGSAVAQESRDTSEVPAANSSSPVSGTQTLVSHHASGATPQQQSREPHPMYIAATNVSNAQCFVKGVQKNVTEAALRNTLVGRFGPIKNLDLVRSKACGFLEFSDVDAARRAIVASLPASTGGEGGIPIDVGDGQQVRITVETRKERRERPRRPRGGRGGPAETSGRGLKFDTK